MTDTHPEAAAVQFRILQQLDPMSRLLLALDLSSTARALLQSRILSEHPGWLPAMILQEVLRCTLRPEELPPHLVR